MLHLRTIGLTFCASLLCLLSPGTSTGDERVPGLPGDNEVPDLPGDEITRGDTVRIAGDCLRVDKQLHSFVLGAFAAGDKVTAVPLSAVAGCVTDRVAVGAAPEGAGVSPFAGLCGIGTSPVIGADGQLEVAPEGAGVSPFTSDCDLAGHVVGDYLDGTLSVSIINPDSMHPVCVVGAAPTPHP